jgi:hypothetical protein
MVVVPPIILYALGALIGVGTKRLQTESSLVAEQFSLNKSNEHGTQLL